MLAFLLLTACASAPSQTANEPEVVVNVDSTPALLRSERDEDDLFAGEFSVALDADLFRYEASYELDRGDVFLSATPDSATEPQRLGSQQFDQNIRLRLPELAGAPISLGVSSETSSSLLLSGYSQTQQEYADLAWSPGPARVDISWKAAGMPYDASAALECNLKSTVRLPTHEGVNHSTDLCFPAPTARSRRTTRPMRTSQCKPSASATNGRVRPTKAQPCCRSSTRSACVPTNRGPLHRAMNST